MAYQISISLSQMPPAPTLAEAGTPEFDAKAFPFVQSWTTIYSELNTWTAQANDLASWIEAQISGVDLDALQAVRDQTYVAANFGGEWNDTDDFAGKSCTKGCIVYASAVPAGGANVGNDPETDDGTYWVKLSTTAPIDEQLRNYTVLSMSYDSVGRLDRVDYAGGYYAALTYDTDGRVSREAYCDADDVTLLSISYTYDAATGELISITRGA